MHRRCCANPRLDSLILSYTAQCRIIHSSKPVSLPCCSASAGGLTKPLEAEPPSAGTPIRLPSFSLPLSDCLVVPRRLINAVLFLHRCLADCFSCFFSPFTLSRLQLHTYITIRTLPLITSLTTLSLSAISHHRPVYLPALLAW
ncbi:hypothetical protein CGRA01v4_02243 [Colletotrichum graminicola]|nr:hypothetical protein CGRA01v4_02243 [Colletotrichum graminicola]